MKKTRVLNQKQMGFKRKTIIKKPRVLNESQAPTFERTFLY